VRTHGLEENSSFPPRSLSNIRSENCGLKIQSRRQRQEQELKQFAGNCAKKHDRSCSRAKA
jgi:hypothetical protein